MHQLKVNWLLAAVLFPLLIIVGEYCVQLVMLLVMLFLFVFV